MSKLTLRRLVDEMSLQDIKNIRHLGFTSKIGAYLFKVYLNDG